MQPAGPLLDDLNLFNEVLAHLDVAGYAKADIEWSENCGPPTTAEDFAREAIFVICNSGMRATIAAGIYKRCMAAVEAGLSASTAFGHRGKAGAIDLIWKDRVTYFSGYLQADDKIEFCRSIPWIGGITCYHLAKNFGAQVAKPDVHLVRLAERHAASPQELCEHLAQATGYKVATIDLILWRACAEGILDGRTASLVEPVIQPPPPPVQVELFEPTQGELFAI